MNNKLGLSGRIARQFQDNELTPLLALTALLLGLFAVALLALSLYDWFSSRHHHR